MFLRTTYSKCSRHFYSTPLSRSASIVQLFNWSAFLTTKKEPIDKNFLWMKRIEMSIKLNKHLTLGKTLLNFPTLKSPPKIENEFHRECVKETTHQKANNSRRPPMYVQWLLTNCQYNFNKILLSNLNIYKVIHVQI